MPLFRKKKTKYIWLIIGAVIIGLLFYSIMVLTSLRWHLNELADQVERIVAVDGKMDIEQSQSSLLAGQTIIAEAQEDLRKLGFVRIIPIVSAFHKNTMGAFTDTSEVLADLEILLREADTVKVAGFEDFILKTYLQELEPAEFNRQQAVVTETLGSLQDNLFSLHTHLSEIEASPLALPFARQLRELTTASQKTALLVEQGRDLFGLMPYLIGYPEPTEYLLLFQNNHELRPTGGFVGSYGVATVADGELQNVFIDDIYHLDSEVIGRQKIEPPAPIRKYLDVQYWYMRDGNWSPDFATSAAKMREFYELEAGRPAPSAVIAITPDVISDLLGVMGGILVEDVFYQAENFTNSLQYEVEQNFEQRGLSHWDRKDVLDTLAVMLVDRIGKLPLSKLAEVISVVHNSLQKKDILIYFDDAQAQYYAEQAQWTGTLQPYKNDFLMVVDSNMAAFKTNQHISRTVSYQIEEVKPVRGEKFLQSKVTVDYKHGGQFSWDTTRYRTYTRIYVPEGAILTDWSGAMENDRTPLAGKIDIYQEAGYTVFGAFIAIEPGQSGRLSFSYRLPQLRRAEYSLLYQKQPGTRDLLKTMIFSEKIKEYEINEDLILP
ncbi:MAG: DUF4012 domain-containing protein [Candidatus Komeilibacteria bacterium]|nr:DUF4012 domain-containing protein [Candidatus Komeilibacteria bacterium]